MERKIIGHTQKHKEMTAEELYKKEFSNADRIPKESAIRLIRHFGMVLSEVKQKTTHEKKQAASEAWDDGFDSGIHYDDADAPNKNILKQQYIKKYDK